MTSLHSHTARPLRRSARTPVRLRAAFALLASLVRLVERLLPEVPRWR